MIPITNITLEDTKLPDQIRIYQITLIISPNNLRN